MLYKFISVVLYDSLNLKNRG